MPAPAQTTIPAPAESAPGRDPIASQINNVLHVIRGTSEIIENAWEGMPDGHRYFEMLRESVDAAAHLTSTMIKQAGSLHEKISATPAPLPETPVSAPPVPAPRGNGELLMIVDDNDAVIRVTSRMLTAQGYRATAARSGPECLRLYKGASEPVALIVMDFHMPGMNGEQVLAELLAFDPGAAVLLSSGFSERDALQRMLAKGLLGFLPKPHTQRELLTQIRAILDALAGTKTIFSIAV